MVTVFIIVYRTCFFILPVGIIELRKIPRVHDVVIQALAMLDIKRQAVRMHAPVRMPRACRVIDGNTAGGTIFFDADDGIQRPVFDALVAAAFHV